MVSVRYNVVRHLREGGEQQLAALLHTVNCTAALMKTNCRNLKHTRLAVTATGLSIFHVVDSYSHVNNKLAGILCYFCS